MCVCVCVCVCVTLAALCVLSLTQGSVCSYLYVCDFGCSVHSCLTLCDPMDCQAPLSIGFPRREDWSRLPFPSPRSSFTWVEINKFSDIFATASLDRVFLFGFQPYPVGKEKHSTFFTPWIEALKGISASKTRLQPGRASLPLQFQGGRSIFLFLLTSSLSSNLSLPSDN